MLAKREIESQFAGSFLGFIWMFIHPIITIFIFWLIFSIGFRVKPASNVPYIVWFASGMSVWFFFSEAMNGAVGCIVANSFLITKTRFKPKILLPVKFASIMLSHFVFLVIFFFLIIVNRMPLSIFYLQFVYYLFCIIVLSIGLGFAVASLNVFIRDISHIVRILLQVCFWATPIVWQIEMMPDRIQGFFKLNPIYYVVQGYRDSFIFFTPFWRHPWETLYFWVVALVVFSAGIYIFNTLERQFPDVL
jgi:lipopolysaccharide transport system permease protein